MQDEPDGPDSEYGFESCRNRDDEKDNAQPASMGTKGAGNTDKSNRGDDRSP